MVSESCGARLRLRPIQSRGLVSQRPRRAAGLCRGGNMDSEGCRPGDAVAQFLLGDQYAKGEGVSQDYAEALIWFRKAAEQNHPVAKLYPVLIHPERQRAP